MGFEPQVVDLREYFGEAAKLWQLVESAGSVFVLGGNVFILRQAMYLSGLDQIIIDQKENSDFLYSGHSAAGCVLHLHLSRTRSSVIQAFIHTGSFSRRFGRVWSWSTSLLCHIGNLIIQRLKQPSGGLYIVRKMVCRIEPSEIVAFLRYDCRKNIFLKFG